MAIKAPYTYMPIYNHKPVYQRRQLFFQFNSLATDQRYI